MASANVLRLVEKDMRAVFNKHVTLKHVKPLVLRLIPLRSCRITVPSDYESNETESALVHYNISRADG